MGFGFPDSIGHRKIDCLKDSVFDDQPSIRSLVPPPTDRQYEKFEHAVLPSLEDITIGRLRWRSHRDIIKGIDIRVGRQTNFPLWVRRVVNRNGAAIPRGLRRISRFWGLGGIVRGFKLTRFPEFCDQFLTRHTCLERVVFTRSEGEFVGF